MSRHLRIEMAGGLSRQAVIRTLRSLEPRGRTDRALARKLRALGIRGTQYVTIDPASQAWYDDTQRAGVRS